MALLPHKQILSLHAAVVSARLTSSRTALLGGIDPAFADGLPTCTSPSSQILSDLHGLNAAGRLGDGAVPFTMWLANALALVAQRDEAEVFRSALFATEATDGTTRSGSAATGDDIADELSRIGRAVLLAPRHHLTRSLYEVEALLARYPHHVEARLLRERIKHAVEVAEVVRGFDPDTITLGTPRSYQGDIRSAVDAPLAVESQLRALLSSFTGRERELFELTNQLGSGGVLISGLAGVGKTALARELARTLEPFYPDLRLSFDLKGTSQAPLSAAAVMAEVVRAFLPAVPLPDRAEELAGLYHAVLNGQRALILLDNAQDRAQIEPLLPPDGSVLIVTSRRRFALPGVHVMSLDGLAPSDAQALLRGLAPRLDDHEAATLAELSGYLPFTLQLAGKAMSNRLDLTPEAYAERLRDAQVRHGLIDAALSVSFDLLDAVLQALWCRLAFFTSGFSAGNACASVPREARTIMAALSDLVAHGMLEEDEDDNEQGTGRYSVHPAARSFAMSHLREPDRAEAERRRESLEQSNRTRASFWAMRLGRMELENALSTARRVGQRHAEALYLERLICHHDNSTSDAELGEQALAIFREVGDKHGESRMLKTLERLYVAFNDERRAKEIHEQKEALFNEVFEEYRKIYDERLAYSLAYQLGDRQGQAYASWRRSQDYKNRDEMEKAIVALQVCVDIERAIGSHEVEKHADELDKLRASLKK